VSQVDLDQAVGYALKRAATALRAAMDAELREHDLSVPQYACLELLAARPGLSNAELARGAFVSRQAMHQLLGGLLATGLVQAVGEGRAQRLSLTPAGERRRAAASAAVAAVEERMLAPLTPAARRRLHADLEACARALATPAERRVPATTAG
jgi:DNA-binding MarR family transcriptional regulator